MVFLPLAGGLTLIFVGDSDEAGRRRVRLISMAVSLAAFFVSAAVYVSFRENFAGMQFIATAMLVGAVAIISYLTATPK